MSVITVKEVRIKNTGGTYDTQPIGAEGQYIDISRDATGEIIEDITAPGVVVASTEGLAETLKNIEESVAGSNEFSEMTDVDFTSLADKNLVQYDNATEKWKNIAMDTTPTASSNKPVTSGGVKTALDAKANNADLKAVAKTGNASDVNYTNTTSGLTATKVQTAIDEVDSNVDSLKETLTQEINENGVKNIIPFPYSSTNGRVNHSITYTYDSDGVVNANGTADAASTFYMFQIVPASELQWLNGMVLCGLTDGDNNNYFSINMNTSPWTSYARCTTTGVVISGIPNDSSIFVDCIIRVGSGKQLTNKKFYPMICRKDLYDADPTWQPPSRSNQQLTKETTGLIDNQNVNGAVNMLPNNATTQVVNGVTFTVNSDGTVTANGTATADAQFNFSIEKYGVDGEFILSGCPSGGSFTTYWLSFWNKTDNTYTNDLGNGANVAISSNKKYRPSITIKSGQTVNNLVFKPMITVPSYTGDYVPYAKSNQQLTKETTGLIDNTEVNGAVNFHRVLNTSQVINGITWTVNDDGTVTANGTATADSVFKTQSKSAGTSYYDEGMMKAIAGKTIRFSGCPKNGSSSTYFLRLYIANDGGSQDEFGDGYNRTISSNFPNLNFSIECTIKSGQTVSNLVFKPMISVASLNLSYDDYVPYAKSNKELTDEVTRLDGEAVKIVDSGQISENSSHSFTCTNYEGYRLSIFSLGADSVGMVVLFGKHPSVSDIRYSIFYCNNRVSYAPQISVSGSTLTITTTTSNCYYVIERIRNT